MTHSNWRYQALCAQIDPDLPYPDDGMNARAIIKVCDSCPVALECLTDGWTEPYGVWGGLTQRARAWAKREGRTPLQALTLHREKRTQQREARIEKEYLRTHFPCGHLRTGGNTYLRVDHKGDKVHRSTRCKTCVNRANNIRRGYTSE